MQPLAENAHRPSPTTAPATDCCYRLPTPTANADAQLLPHTPTVAPTKTPTPEFVVEDGTLVGYNGTDTDVIVPETGRRTNYNCD